MKIIPIASLENERFTLFDIHSQKHTPINRTIFHENGRLLNGFLFFAQGSGTFSCEGRTVSAKEGSLVYLPQGARHRYTATSEKILHIRIDFLIECASDGQRILFSDTPVLMLESVSPRIRETIENLAENSANPQAGQRLKDFALLSVLLAEIADSVRNLSVNSVEKKILPGIHYIEKNYNKELDLKQAAGLCDLSESRFRALFKQVTGYSSVEYRDKLRIEKACALLLSGFMRISEIADMLGYGSVYYFSRSFKKATGLSPLQYKNNQIVQK